MVFDGSLTFGFRINEDPRMINTESKPAFSLHEKYESRTNLCLGE